MLNYATKLLGPCAALLLSTPALAQANAFSTLAVESNILIQSYEEKAVLCQDVVREGGMSHEYCQQMVELGTSAANALGKVKDAAKSNDDEIVVEILRLRLVAAEDAEAGVWAIVN
jgi:hypothetical protein